MEESRPRWASIASTALARVFCPCQTGLSVPTSQPDVSDLSCQAGGRPRGSAAGPKPAVDPCPSLVQHRWPRNLYGACFHGRQHVGLSPRLTIPDRVIRSSFGWPAKFQCCFFPTAMAFRVGRRVGGLIMQSRGKRSSTCSRLIPSARRLIPTTIESTSRRTSTSSPWRACSDSTGSFTH